MRGHWIDTAHRHCSLGTFAVGLVAGTQFAVAVLLLGGALLAIMEAKRAGLTGVSLF
jgi:hypothetical protein